MALNTRPMGPATYVGRKLRAGCQAALDPDSTLRERVQCQQPVYHPGRHRAVLQDGSMVITWGNDRRKPWKPARKTPR